MIRNNSKIIVILLFIFSFVLIPHLVLSQDEVDYSSCEIFSEKFDFGDYYEFALRAELRRDYKSALKFYKMAYDYGNVWDEFLIQIYSLVSVSRIQIYTDKFSEALENLQEVENLNNGVGNIEIEAMLKENYGLMYYKMEDYVNAEIMYLEALKIYKKCDVNRSIASMFNNISLVYIETDNYIEAENLLLRSAKLNSQLNNDYSLSSNFSNLGLLYKLMGNFDDSEKAYLKTIELAKKIKAADIMGKELKNLADLYFEFEKFQPALEYYEKVVRFANSIDENNIEYLYLAYESCKQVIKLAQRTNDIDLEKEYIKKKEWFIDKLKESGEDISED